MKVLVTGGTGFLGKNLLDRLKKDSHEVLIFDKGMPDGDILGFQPNFIFHFAGEIRNTVKMFDSNVRLAHRLLETCLKLENFQGMIVLGSSSEYGKKPDPMCESDAREPISWYGGTKAASTMLCTSFAHEHNLPISVIYPFSVYGYYDHDYKLVPTLYKKIIEEEIIDLCEGNHDWIFCEDFIDLVMIVSQNMKVGDIINAGTGIQTSNAEMIQVFVKLLREKAKINYRKGFKKEDSRTWVCDPTYASKAYGWRAQTSLEEGIKKYIYWRDKHLI